MSHFRTSFFFKYPDEWDDIGQHGKPSDIDWQIQKLNITTNLHIFGFEGVEGDHIQNRLQHIRLQPSFTIDGGRILRVVTLAAQISKGSHKLLLLLRRCIVELQEASAETGFARREYTSRLHSSGHDQNQYFSRLWPRGVANIAQLCVVKSINKYLYAAYNCCTLNKTVRGRLFNLGIRVVVKDKVQCTG